MEILAHRGLWTQPIEKNSLGALLLAIQSGFGIETDIRDLSGELVISHDPPKKGALLLETFLSKAEREENFKKAFFALNVKADGLDVGLERVLREYGLEKQSFFFDMTTPTLYSFSKRFEKENLCTRISDIEPEPLLLEKCNWVWVDCFKRDWGDWKKLPKLKRKLAFVSPELHKRSHERFWRELEIFAKGRKDILLCTDLPSEARGRFG
jgi:glycerophosphoryl diester phosphodiesterase